MTQVDPFAELEARHISQWKALFTDEPELLDALQTQPKGIIRSWDEIPDLMTMAVPTIEWVVEGILPRGSVTLIAGEPGSYKSWLALSLLRAVATGGRFLDRQCKSTGVLYLDRENPQAVVRERLSMLGVESLSGSRIWGGWLPDAPPVIGDSRLLQIARDHRPLTIFDSLIRFHGADENSASEMAPVMEGLRQLANADATVVALHHKPKAEGSHYRGSSDIAGAVDTAFAVSRDRKAGLLTLECFKSRFLEEFSITLRPDLSGTGEFIVTEAPDATAERSDAERIAQVIRANPGRTQSELLASSGVAQGRARAILARFDGQLWRVEPGVHNSKHFFPLEAQATIEMDI